MSILLYGCTTWTLSKRMEKNLDGNETRCCEQILNKSWRQHPTKQQLYGDLQSITKTIKIRRTRHAGYCWRSKDELISDVLLCTPSHGRAKAGRPARTYIRQLCADTGCSPKDLSEAMNDREGWRERVMDIRADGATSWIYISIIYKNFNIQSGEVLACSLWGRLCISDTSRVSPLVKQKDTVPSATSTHVCLLCGRFFRSFTGLMCHLHAQRLLGACKWEKKNRKWSCLCASWQRTYIYIYIYHHQVALLARISLTLSLSLSFFLSLSLSLSIYLSIRPYRPSPSAGLPDYVLCPRRAFVGLVGRLTLVRSCEGVHKRTSLINLSLFLQQCPAYLVHLTWMILEMGG